MSIFRVTKGNYFIYSIGLCAFLFFTPHSHSVISIQALKESCLKFIGKRGGDGTVPREALPTRSLYEELTDPDTQVEQGILARPGDGFQSYNHPYLLRGIGKDLGRKESFRFGAQFVPGDRKDITAYYPDYYEIFFITQVIQPEGSIDLRNPIYIHSIYWKSGAREAFQIDPERIRDIFFEMYQKDPIIFAQDLQNKIALHITDPNYEIENTVVRNAKFKDTSQIIKRIYEDQMIEPFSRLNSQLIIDTLLLE